MKIGQFGRWDATLGYAVVDERTMRASAGLMLLLGVIAMINGFVLSNYEVIPYISGFMMTNFLIGIFVNLEWAPTYFIAKRIVAKQTPLYIGAVQKRFAWGLGLLLTTGVFVLSFFLLQDVSYFENVCSLCLWCTIFVYLESAFGICVGCKLYFLAIRLRLLKEPEIRPNCMGDACEVK
ncbi:MAG: hypothetical protein KU37_00090 [Sulfuricurvum sp. PC08-66]|nr:MAG: hypothetical protein KU37_00090 [Sulfuricurvum sp. PC08-66]